MSVESKVPEIRFEGFSGVWEECSLSKFVSSLDAGVSVNSGEQPAGESEFGILKTSCVTNGVFEPYENKVVFETDEISRLKEPVLKNTIIISRMNTPALVGANAYIDRNFENYFLPDRLWAAKPAFIGDLRFIAYILGSAKGRAALSELATGTSASMKNISKPSVFELKFQAPVDKEQTKIGNYFQQLDTLIAQHQDKHDKLLQIKKSLLEKMFPKQGEAKPEIRFKGFSEQWEERELGEVGELKNGMNFGKEAMGHGYPFVNLQDVFGKNKISDKNLGLAISTVTQRKEYSLQKGDVLFIRSSVKPEGVGEAAIVAKNFDNTTYSGFIIRFRPSVEMDANFNRFIYSTVNIRKQILSSATSSANTNINQESLQRINLTLPDIKEQTQIGNLFKNLDTLLNQHQSQLKKLKQIKQACLAKMFV